MPYSKLITGYSGPTDGLVVFDIDDRVKGIRVRHSYDTPGHVEDVTLDLLFMESWNGKSWKEIAAIKDLSEAGIYAVSGATRTSEAFAESVCYRTRTGFGSGFEHRLRFRWRDILILFVLAGGCLSAFSKSRRIQRFRFGFQVFSVVVFGILLGDLLAQSLLIGWAESRIPWESTPGLVLFAAAMFLLPWFTRQPVYCQYICPHGILQRWITRIRPAKWMVKLNDDVKWVGRLVPVTLLFTVMLVSFFRLPVDLAGIEPFDAYLIKSAGLATCVVFGAGLLVSIFIPMAYCKFGCPTGQLLEFVRRRAAPNSFQVRDGCALVFLLVAIGLHMYLR